ncbi:S8 family peptidase [Kordiimonas laminariae]|uniref:S8 family peptidase n=1 Tax=Kordiimonas laminariae TaxID=2917717 RepID=UPI001FF2DF7A|nr:S8/S53 family peptidase [Kordiimonas laminariae]MCK0070726.1 S8/S53 family peptidase [Kordiimonas laminariae]
MQQDFLTLVVVGDNSERIRFHLEVTIVDNGQLTTFYTCISEDGQVEIPITCTATVGLKIVPLEGYWSTYFVSQPKAGSYQIQYQAQRIQSKDAIWWHTLVKGRNTHLRGKGIKIGIIDIGFTQFQNITEFELIKSTDASTFLQPASHGQRVAKILRGNYRGETIGLAPETEVIFFDASYDDDILSKIAKETMPNYLSLTEIAKGIEYLSKNRKVDIINISSGIYESFKEYHDTRVMLEEVIEEALDNGTVCICASGNDAQAGMAYPASSEHSIGVASVGFSAVCPEGTLAQQEFLMSEQKCWINIPNSQNEIEIFQPRGTSFGLGVNICAPGIGIALPIDDDIFVDYEGSSYATPIATGVLACELGRSENIRKFNGREKSEYILQILKNTSINIELPSERVGIGLPVLI